jgi:hypothetical protein
MTEDHLYLGPAHRRIGIGLFALSCVLFVWILFEQRVGDSGINMVFLTASMVLNTGTIFVRRNSVKFILIGGSLSLVVASFLTR